MTDTRAGTPEPMTARRAWATAALIIYLAVMAIVAAWAIEQHMAPTTDEDALTITGRCPAGWDNIYYRNGRWYCAAPWLRTAYGQYYTQAVTRGRIGSRNATTRRIPDMTRTHHDHDGWPIDLDGSAAHGIATAIAITAAIAGLTLTVANLLGIV